MTVANDVASGWISHGSSSTYLPYTGAAPGRFGGRLYVAMFAVMLFCGTHLLVCGGGSVHGCASQPPIELQF